MSDEKGKPTMMNVAHASNQPGATVGGVSIGNFEPLILELIKAVRAVSLTVNVPALGLPDINVEAPQVTITAPAVEPNANALPAAAPTIQVMPAEPIIMVPGGPIWLLGLGLLGHLALKALELFHAVH